MRNAHFGLTLAASVLLCLSVTASTNAATTGSVLDDERYQRAMPSEPGGIANQGTRGLGGGGASGKRAGSGSENATPQRSDPGSAESRESTRRAPPQPREERPPLPPQGPPPDMTAIGKAVLWIVLIVVGAVFLFWLVMLFRRLNFGLRWRRTRRDPKTALEKPAAHRNAMGAAAADASSGSEILAVPQRPLTEWEQLAAAGDHAGAVRAILRHAVALLRQKPGATISPDLTSREVLRAVRSNPDAAKPLSTIVGAVEFVHFGGRQATVAHYETCTASLAQIDRDKAPA